MSIEATLYKKPNGTTQEITVRNIYPEDEAWFKANGAIISMEDHAGNFVVYADVGLTHSEGDPYEAIEFSSGRSCEDTMQALRAQCERMLIEAGRTPVTPTTVTKEQA